ncbi:hypothetical protein PRBEI_2001835500 [Prionailurus iriomotensis]
MESFGSVCERKPKMDGGHIMLCSGVSMNDNEKKNVPNEWKEKKPMITMEDLFPEFVGGRSVQHKK